MDFLFKLMSILREPILAVGAVVGAIYRFLFGWLDVRLSKREETRFAREIRLELAFLFNEHGGTFVPDPSAEYPLPFDYAVVTVVTDNLRFRFTRGRGGLSGKIAPNRAPDLWHDLRMTLSRVDLATEVGGGDELYSLENIGLLLRPRMLLLEAAFSEREFPQLDRLLSELEGHTHASTGHWVADADGRVRKT